MNKVGSITILRFIILVSLIPLSFSEQTVAQESKKDIDYHLDFRDANTLMGEQADYQSALEKYLSIASTRGLSENLAFNIATCYYKTDQLGYARLYLERALLINPHNPDVQNNLNVLLKKLNLEEPEASTLEVISLKLNSNTWFLLGFAFVLMPFLILFLKQTMLSFAATKAQIGPGFWATASIASIAGIALIYLSLLNASLSKCGIVIAQETTLKQSPFEQADVTATVSEGRKIQITKSHSDFFLCVEKTEGIKGWISKNDFVSIIPIE